MISTALSNQQQLVQLSSQTPPHSAQTDPKACPLCRLQIICDTEKIPGVVYPFIQNHQNSLHIQSAVLRGRMDCYFLHRCVQVSHYCCSYPKMFSANDTYCFTAFVPDSCKQTEAEQWLCMQDDKEWLAREGRPSFHEASSVTDVCKCGQNKRLCCRGLSW